MLTHPVCAIYHTGETIMSTGTEIDGIAGTPLDERTVTYGDVTFEIRKLLPVEAKRVFMAHVRPLLRGALSAQAPTGEMAPEWALVLAAFTDAPQEHYDAIVRALYGNILYSSPAQSTPKRLLGDEEHAFKDLDMAHMILLDARAFIVNFSASWDVVQSEFPALVRVFR